MVASNLPPPPPVHSDIPIEGVKTQLLTKKMVPETTEMVKVKERVKSELYSTTGGNQSTVWQLDK